MGLEADPKTRSSWELAVAPPVERWDDWVELDPAAWPKRVERHDQLVPTICCNCLMYHVGRPGEDHFVLRMLQAWGVDGHNRHTNVCSASARPG